MVMPGQFLERATLVPVREDLVLEGLAHRGNRRPGLLMVSPLPHDGGGMDNVVASEVIWALTQAGFPSLRFNFRGVGASQGEKGDRAALLEDLRSAHLVMGENVGSDDVGLVTVRSSALLALALAEASPSVRCLVLVNPRAIEPALLLHVRVPLAVVLGADDSTLDRAALSEAVAQVGGELTLVPNTDQVFQRNLPLVGKAALRAFEKVSSF
jgi:uncharacterized protein